MQASSLKEQVNSLEERKPKQRRQERLFDKITASPKAPLQGIVNVVYSIKPSNQHSNRTHSIMAQDDDTILLSYAKRLRLAFEQQPDCIE